MNIFRFRDSLINDYASYVQSFIHIQDERIRQQVEDNLEKGLLWPDPFIQLNPAFEPGEWIDELVDKGLLHDECRRIFRIKSDSEGEGNPLRLHKHQADALRAAKTGKDYVLTTGTGSGKSLAYIVPIVDHVLRRGSQKGIQAIIIYPMNALCNSQHDELVKFLCHGYPPDCAPVRFAKYTGQESDEVKQGILTNPPDIILTNYMMLELILTRPYDQELVKASQGLQFLVLDELHTYRGRQGADVALLVRRLRNACNAENLQCIGTSATLAGPGTYEEQQQEIAAVAGKLFGTEVQPDLVIGESLRKVTPDRDLSNPDFLKSLKERVIDPNVTPPREYEKFVNDPLSIWIENTFGVTTEKLSGRLIRTKPRCLTGEEGAALELSSLIRVPVSRCTEVIQEGLLAGYHCLDPSTGFPVFAFRLHQFISRGDYAYCSPEPEEKRYITLYGQQFVPGDRSRTLLPMVFCRECGQEYYCVRKVQDKETNRVIFIPRELADRFSDEEGEAGFLFRNSGKPWPEDEIEVLERLPEDWIIEESGNFRLRDNRRPLLPELVRLAPDGQQTPDGATFHFLKAPFRFCLNCGVSYGMRQASDIGKLTSLGTEGRSTATTILSLAAIRRLRQEDAIPESSRKLLSFTDNRQDASLQAGHFNDFIEIGLLRSALYRAVKKAGAKGIRHDELTQEVFAALDLPLHYFARDPEVKFASLKNTEKALKNVIGYRLYHDLRRGWRVTSPNLEQCGLLEIAYLSLTELCEASEEWQNVHEALLTASPETRAKVCRVLLDLMRRELAIRVNYLDATFQESIRHQSDQHLIAPWAIDENERLMEATVIFPRSQRPKDYGGHRFISPRSGFGQFLRRASTFPDYQKKISVAETSEIIMQLLRMLKIAGLVEELPANNEDEVPGYQIPAAAFLWQAGAGTQPFHDIIRVPRAPETGGRTNPFFKDFYQHVALESKGLEAHEHTAQVDYEKRIEREKAFRAGKLPILYCSPTMELGIDIATLNIVNMRNIPPTPANYAQRSGRAGRSGQPALVYSYCTTGSPHDQYFFKRPEQMVSGSVTPPRLELANEDLIKSHIHAVWLAATGLSLGSSLRDILDVSGDNPTLELQKHVKDAINDAKAKQRTFKHCQAIFSTLTEELQSADWYSAGWLDETLNQVGLAFDQACDRWRSLYRAAAKQREVQNKIIGDASASAENKKQAKRLRREAEAQMDLLLETKNIMQSDFYSYRYFASEGFLPGYNFPRLPLSAYIPGQRNRKDEFLSRPRFLAISEFGPRGIIYHEGSRFLIHKVIMPVGEDEVLTTAAKLCPKCGYLHPILYGGQGLDNCEQCQQLLDHPIRQLFRLQNVATRRKDRINCDEEERLRLGYEIKTGVRFTLHKGKLSLQTATVYYPDSNPLVTLSYGNGATLWRINLGWSRRQNKDQLGFVLDTERGYWAKNDLLTAEEDDPDPMSAKTVRVVPYVEDHRNCLILKPIPVLDKNQMASLQSVLKQAIQAYFQLEDNELAAEPLPNQDERQMILFYEAAEGGAGVLRQLVANPTAFAEVAKVALDICHFDPITGEDKRRGPRAREDCEAACYDCLLNYGNQRDHQLLDRQTIKDFLYQLSQARTSVSPVGVPRSEHLKKLMDHAGSDLERNWLDFLEERQLHLPSKAQHFMDNCKTRPDFIYDEHLAVIYVDGPPHDYPERQKRDAEQTDCLEDLGYTVIRFRHQDDWESKVAKFPHIFGVVKKI